MADDAGDEADDGFSLDEFTGWSDCESTMGVYPAYYATPTTQVPVKKPAKKPRAKSGGLHKPIPKTESGGSIVPSVANGIPAVISDLRCLSGSVWHGDLTPSSVLLEEEAPTFTAMDNSGSAGAMLAPVMILPVQEKTSPLAKPFTVFKYTSLQVYRPSQLQQHPSVQFHVVTSQPPDDSLRPLPSEPRDDHLPPLISLRDALGAPSAKTAHWSVEESTSVQVVTSEPRRQSAQRVQPAASNKMQWTITTPSQANSANGSMKKKQLVKNDKPAVRSQLTLARAQDASSRRYSDAAKRSHEAQRVVLDSSYLSTALYAPRRQSLSNAPLIDEDDSLLHELSDDAAENRVGATGLLRTITQFSTAHSTGKNRIGAKYRSAKIP